MKKQTLIAVGLIAVFAIGYLALFLPKDNGAGGNGGVTKEPPFRKDSSLIFKKASDSTFSKKVDIEIADEEWERARGLMYRTKLSDNQAMLFIFDYEEPQSFWMRNTYISLDIIYVDSNKEIVSIAKYAQPRSDESLPSKGPAQYVVEVPGGFCDRYGIGESDRVEF